MSIEKFSEALKDNNLLQAKKIFEAEKSNQEIMISVIFYHANLDMIQHLIKKNVDLNTTNERCLLLILLTCKNIEKIESVLKYLLDTNHYLKFGNNIHRAHIEAALGSNYLPWSSENLYHKGFLPRHFAAVRGNKYLKEDSFVNLYCSAHS